VSGLTDTPIHCLSVVAADLYACATILHRPQALLGAKWLGRKCCVWVGLGCLLQPTEAGKQATYCWSVLQLDVGTPHCWQCTRVAYTGVTAPGWVSGST
jgi:hypothetical protein